MQQETASRRWFGGVRKAFDWLFFSQSCRATQIAFISTFFFALCAHAFCWMNLLYNHDSLLIVQNDWFHQAAIGRPLQQFYVAVRGEVVAPWLIGLLGTLFLACANCTIVSLLRIRARAFVALSCGAITTSATVTLLNATYIDWYDVFMLSFFLSCAAVWFAARGGIRWALVGAIILAFSLGLYQSYLQTAMALAMMICIFKLLFSQRDSWLFVRNCVLVFAIGVLTYLLIQSLARFVLSIDVSDAYNSISTAFDYGDASLWHVVLHVWLDPFVYLLRPETHAIRLCAFANATVMVLLLISIVVISRRRKIKPWQVGLIAFLLLCWPFAAGCVNLAAFGSVHGLMILSYYLFYPFAFAVFDAYVETAPKSDSAHAFRLGVIACTVGVMVVGVVFSNTVYANQVYVKKALGSEAMLSTMTRLEGDLENLEGYVPGETSVVIIGRLMDGNVFPRTIAGFPPEQSQPQWNEYGYTDYGVGLWDQMCIRDSQQIAQYFDYILDCPIKISDAEYDLAEGEEESMPQFPLKGSVILRDGVAVVRLS